MLTIFLISPTTRQSTILEKTIAQQFLREPCRGGPQCEGRQIRKGLIRTGLGCPAAVRLEAESRPDPNAGKTGGQAWGMKSLYDALTLVIGRLKTVVDLASGLSKRWHGRSEPKAP